MVDMTPSEATVSFLLFRGDTKQTQLQSQASSSANQRIRCSFRGCQLPRPKIPPHTRFRRRKTKTNPSHRLGWDQLPRWLSPDSSCTRRSPSQHTMCTRCAHNVLWNCRIVWSNGTTIWCDDRRAGACIIIVHKHVFLTVYGHPKGMFTQRFLGSE